MCQLKSFSFVPELFVDFDEVEFGDVIGRGSYAVVYKGNWRNNTVALKCINISKMLQTADQLQEIAILRFLNLIM